MDHTNDHWIPVGPAPEDMSALNNADVSGAVWTIAFSTDFDGQGTPAMFIGTAGGGVWRSTNFTSASPTWSPLTDHVPSLVPVDRQIGLLNIGALAVDPNHPRTIYAGSGDPTGSNGNAYGRGMLKSTDGGNSWSLLTVAAATFAPGFTRIIVDPTDHSGNTVYAAGGFGPNSPLRGIYKSVDGGANWALAQGGMPGAIAITDLDFTVSDGQLTLFAGVNDTTGRNSGANGIWQSTDGGRSWAQMLIRPLTDLQTGQRVTKSAIGLIKLAADHTPSAPHGVFAAVSNATSSTLLNVFNLAGRIWEPCGLGIQGIISTYAALAVGLSESGGVYVGMNADSTATDGIYQSPDGGSTWASILMGTNGVRPHHDQRCWGFGAGIVFEGNDGGIYRFNPAPVLGPGVWESLNTTSLQTILSNGFGLHPQYPNVMVEGSQDNGTALRTFGRWRYVDGEDNSHCSFDPYDGRFAYKATLGRFYRSDDGGNAWHETSVPGKVAQLDSPPFAFHPADGGRIAIGIDRVYETRTRGDQWTPISGLRTGSLVSITALAYGTGEVIYAAFGNRLFKTTNDGGDTSDGNWPELNAGIDWHGNIVAIVVDSHDNHKVYLAADGGAIWRSPDAGQSWTEITGDFPRALGANNLAIRSDSAATVATLFVGTNVGVYTLSQQEEITNWKRMGSDLPDVSVTDLEFHRTTKYLVASASGRGLFASYLHFITDVAPGGATVANVVFNFAKDIDGRICVNQAEFGHAFTGWFEAQGDGRTDAAPAAAAVGNHLFVAVKALGGNEIFLNQADLGHSFGQWFPMGFSTDVAPAVAGVGNNVYFFAKSLDGRIFKNQAVLGHVGQGWVEVEGGGRTDAAPAAAAIGNHVFVAVKALGGNEIFLNQADLGGSFGQWFPMGFSTDVAPAVATVGNNVYFFAKSLDGRIFKNQAVLGKRGQGWVEIEGGGRINAAPAANGIGNSIFCFVKGLDGHIYLNQAEVDHSFSGWFEVGGGIY